MKLKHNWKSLGGGVFESMHGVRIHLGGLIKTSDKKYYSELRSDENKIILECYKICGGNRRRGLMLAAERIREGGE